MAETNTDVLPVLIFAPFGKDALLIDRVLRQSSVPVHVCIQIQDLEGSISEDAGAAVITEEVLQSRMRSFSLRRKNVTGIPSNKSAIVVQQRATAAATMIAIT